MSSRSLQDDQSVELHLLKNWAAKNVAQGDGRKRLLQTVIRNQQKKRPNRFIIYIQGLAKPYWGGQPEMSYVELSQWLFNRAHIESLGACQLELRLVT